MTTHRAHPKSDESEPLLSPTSSTSLASSTSPTPIKKIKKKVWHKTASAYWLLPSFMLIAIINGLGITAKVQFYLRAVCYDYYSSKNTGPSFSASFLINPINDYPDELCNNADVQAATSRFLMIMDLCSAVPAIFVLAPLGSLSDIKGRKISLLIATVGLALTTLTLLMVGTSIDTFGLYFLLVGALLEGITGGFISLVTSSYAYATDCTPPTERSMIFGWMQGSFFVGFVGPMIGGWIIEMTNNLLSVFYIILVVYIIAFFYFLFILPESLSKEKLLENLNRQQGPNSSFDRNQLIKSWVIYSILKPLTILFEKKDRNNNDDFFTKYSLLILASINTLLAAALIGIQSVFLLYVTLVFKWSLVDQGYCFLILGISRVVVLLILFPLLISSIKRKIVLKITKNNGNQFNIDNNDSDEPIMVKDEEEKQLRNYEIWILRFALFIDVIAYAGHGLAPSGSAFLFATVIASLGTVSGSVIKSLQTNLVPPSQVGQLLGALSVLDSISRVVSPVAFNALYSVLVLTSPNLIWYGITSLMAMAFILSLGVMPKYN
ncbi:hypothetical protein RclHR1_01170010 [Rhizophagus clarus]|uniref:MFS general substrate transporter n=1 Tax=Rhizophagus clarus TaxID=94130 RepID=A0A2Z6QXX5_9GLOM|nr:hypothetical protein RclHR1_01170010 [Rhizophagus clarus]GES78383.1 MFS general substrate transporter [Rhizophagus clarus]